LEVCKLAAFFEGGISYTELVKMPLCEFFEITKCAIKIAELRRLEMEKSRNGK
jgi:hypothetical protein